MCEHVFVFDLARENIWKGEQDFLRKNESWKRQEKYIEIRVPTLCD